MSSPSFPLFRPIADTGVLVEFGDAIDDDTHQRVLNFDNALANAKLHGFIEATPTYTSVLVNYDPLVTDYDLVCEQLSPYLNSPAQSNARAAHWQFPVCYAESMAPDIANMAQSLNVSTDDIVNEHCSGKYKIYMFGFAPGYAYMGGVPKRIQIPRKTAPVMNVPPKTVMVAGQQCLITTLPMPTGWWRIGMTTNNPLKLHSDKPFMFNVGDTVEFVPLSEKEFHAHSNAT